ncbi:MULTISPECIES: hypothetical protein [unclassified Micromonospora]|uniref:hypothetical protein n=1 Tax=unclassified Micromonospora TaxID=2617518 RepID=UPI003408F3F0
MNKRSARLALAGIAIGTVAAVGVSGAAYAEASWNSSISGAGNGFESRTWYDNNKDSVNGYVYFSGCNANPTVAVYREDLGPDTEVKRGTIYCQNSSGYLYFGDVAKGNYHFTIKSTGTGTQGLSVSYVSVVY